MRLNAASPVILGNAKDLSGKEITQSNEVFSTPLAFLCSFLFVFLFIRCKEFSPGAVPQETEAAY